MVSGGGHSVAPPFQGGMEYGRGWAGPSNPSWSSDPAARARVAGFVEEKGVVASGSVAAGESLHHTTQGGSCLESGKPGQVHEGSSSVSPSDPGGQGDAGQNGSAGGNGRGSGWPIVGDPAGNCSGGGGPSSRDGFSGGFPGGVAFLMDIQAAILVEGVFLVDHLDGVVGSLEEVDSWWISWWRWVSWRTPRWRRW